MKLFENKSKRRGLIGTIIFHLLVLVSFIFLGLSYTYPPEEQGIVINFGTSPEGFGVTETESPSEPEEEKVPTESVETPASPTETVEEVATQEMEETVKVEEKKEEKKEEEVMEEKEEERKPSEELSEALKQSFSKDSQKEGSEGNKKGDSNMGQPDGIPGAKNYFGPAGSGNTYSLGGRKMQVEPKIEEDYKEKGKVVVRITVNKYGKVTKAVPGVRGSTTTDSQLLRLAEKAALETRFNADPEAAEEQQGTITFVFKLN